MSFKDILEEIAYSENSIENQNEGRDWRKFHARFPRINTKQCSEQTFSQWQTIVGDLNWIFKNTNKHPVFYNEWLQEEHPGIYKSNNRGKRAIDKGEVSNFSRQFGYSLMDIERKIRREVRQVFFLERSILCYPEKTHLVGTLEFLRDSMFAYDYLREEYEKNRHLNGIASEAEGYQVEAPIEATETPIVISTGVPEVPLIDDVPVEEVGKKEEDEKEEEITIQLPEDSQNLIPRVREAIKREAVKGMWDKKTKTNEDGKINDVPSTFIRLTSQENDELNRSLRRAQEKGIDALPAIITLAHDLDISFDHIRAVAQKMGYLSKSPRGAKTTPEERKKVLQLFEVELLNGDYTYARYWGLIYTTSLKYRIWPKSVERWTQEKCGFNRPLRQIINTRCRPLKSLFPSLIGDEETEKEEMPETETSAELDFNITTTERRIIDKSLSLDIVRLRKLLNLANLKIPEKVTLSFNNGTLVIGWVE